MGWCAGKEKTKYTEKPPEGVQTIGGSSWTKDWLKFDNSYFTEVRAPPGVAPSILTQSPAGAAAAAGAGCSF